MYHMIKIHVGTSGFFLHIQVDDCDLNFNGSSFTLLHEQGNTKVDFIQSFMRNCYIGLKSSQHSMLHLACLLNTCTNNN